MGRKKEEEKKMDRADISLLAIITCIFLVSYLRVRFGRYVKAERDWYRYRVFKVRDDLIYFVGCGKLERSDFLFQFFYPFTTLFLREADNLNMLNLLETAREQKLDPTDTHVLDRVKTAVMQVDKAVTRSIEELYEAMIDILVWNCSFLRVARYVTTHEALRTILRGFILINYLRTAWQSYKELQSATAEVKQAVTAAA